ncbi:MAG: low molecular weight protein-tyrosine-phosphatase [Armatimonadota bacterium]
MTSPTGSFAPSVLFVCLGNICRSPMAESILIHKASKQGLNISVDSAGTGNWHAGDWPDPRTLQVLDENNIPKATKARQIKTEDFDCFDYIIGMDKSNYNNIVRLPGADSQKVSLLLDWNPATAGMEVPDPYYGDYQDFQELFHILDTAIDHLISQLKPI